MIKLLPSLKKGLTIQNLEKTKNIPAVIVNEIKDEIGLPRLKNEELTQKIIDCGFYADLKKVIIENAPFISYTRKVVREWSVDRLLTNIKRIREKEVDINAITRVNGLRSKVAELILADNYGEPWN